MNIEEHSKKFEKIVQKYNFDSVEKAEEITNYLTKQKEVSAKEFAGLFAIDQNDADLFLSFISKGIQYKKNHLN